MHVSNLHDYGHLLNADSYDTSRVHGDMYQMFDNSLVREREREREREGLIMSFSLYLQDWEKKYIHPNWSQVLQENVTLEQV